MGRLSELEQFLQQQVDEGQRDSSGQFTLSRDKALEKLAAFQLPRASAWVLKVVQGVVASQAPSLTIKQTSTDTEFYFDPAQAWTLAMIEAAFYDPESSDSLALDYLKRGLWAVSLNEMRPFRLALPNHPEALVWTGQEFRRAAGQSPDSVSLMVSHRTLFEGKGIILLRSFEAARVNAQILEELTQFAYVCSIPLTVDRRRIDALQACPSHGQSASSYPIRLGFAKADLPNLTIPPGSLSGYIPKEAGDSRMARVFQSQVTIPSLISVGLLLTAHVARVKEGRTTVWRCQKRDSCIYWVLDGVVVAREALLLPDFSVSCAVFASAQGLRTDLTGFNLARDEVRSARRRKICAAAGQLIRDSSLSLEALISGGKSGSYVLGTLLLASGTMLAFASPFHGVALVGGGLYTVATAGSTERALEVELKLELERLRELWNTA
ncbi:hypothetical protein IV102_11440 [bacterium]|nr:hypothetical protein [bacterium]